MSEVTNDEIKKSSLDNLTETENFSIPLKAEIRKNSIEEISKEFSQIEIKIQEKTQKAENVLVDINKNDFTEQKILNKSVYLGNDWEKEKINPVESLAEVKRLSQDLNEKENLSPEEYLKKSNKIINILDRLEGQSGKERDILKKSYYDGENRWGVYYEREYRNRLEKIDKQLEEISKRKGLKAFLANRRKGELNRNKLEIENKKNNFERSIDTKKKEQEQYTKQVTEFKEKYKPILKDFQRSKHDEIEQDLQSIVADCEKFYHRLVKNKVFINNLRESYIQEFISPRIDKGIDLPKEFKDEFCADLLKSLEVERKTEENSPHQRNEYFFDSQPQIFVSLKDYVKPLFEKKDEDILRHFLTKKMIVSLEPLVGVGYEIGYLDKFGFPEVIEPKAHKGTWDINAPESFGGELAQLIDNGGKVKWKRDEFEFWVALRNSKVANNLFGEEIKRQDINYRQEVLKNSIFDKDGPDIDKLQFYPTPEAIRNLILMAGAKESDGYQKYHANWTLASLAEKSNWPQVLDEAEKEYPSLKKLRTILEKWTMNKEWLNFYYTNPEVRSAVGPFALSILKNTEIEKGQDDNERARAYRIGDLAVKCLDNQTLMIFLKGENLLPEEEVSLFQKAETFLKEYDEKYKPGNIEEILNIRDFKDTLNKNFFKLARQGSEKSDNYELDNLKSLSQMILANKENPQALIYLASEEIIKKMEKLDKKNIEIFLKAYQRCPSLYLNKEFRKEFCQFFESMNPELILAFPQYATALMDEKMRETRLFIFQNGNFLLKDVSDVKFMNILVGEFGKKSDQLIRGYQECLAANAISNSDKEIVLDFAKQFRVIAPITMQGYKEAKLAGHEKVYIAQFQTLAERMTGSSIISEEDRKKPYYKDLLKHVYSKNVGQWGSFESNESCSDRNSDLIGFNIKPRYEIDLLSQNEIRVKDGEALDIVVKEGVQKPILEVAERMNALGHDKEKIQIALQEDVDKILQEILQKGGLEGVGSESVDTIDEKLFLILTDSIYGSRSVDSDKIKDLIINYEFANFEDISDYIAGTSDRVGRANNQDYAFFCELGAFYSDRIKEVNRRLVQAAWSNPVIEAFMPEYFKKLAQETTTIQQKDLINRLQVDKLGFSDVFIKQIIKKLSKKNGREYTSEEVKNIIQRYESWTGGLVGETSTSPKPETRAFYGQLRSQREKTFEALKTITGQEIDPKQAHLGEINLQQALETEANIREGKYNKEEFAAYTAQKFIDLFEEERVKIEGELDKFESLSGKQREVLYGYVTKSKESAHARMTGGVCVACDNPDKYPKENIWNMPNYFQMVFQEPDTLQCQGLVLLHHFNENGKKILAAAINPSSTYLYSVDEVALFKGITTSLEQFATENEFDIIGISENRTIRTNRTGGKFEEAIDERILQVGKKFNFNTPQDFSYHPSNYRIQEMNIIWERDKS